jgi:membrane protease YdiL (CAAX protease family)
MEKGRPIAFFREYWRESLIIACTLAVLTGLFSGFFIPFERGNLIYFSSFANYARGLLLTLVVIIIFLAEPRIRCYREIFLFLQVFMLGYFAADLLFRGFHPKLSVIYRDSPFIVAFYHMDYYLIHRLYQVIPLGLMSLLFFTYPAGYFADYFHLGTWDVSTDLVGKGGGTWKRGTLFFLSVLVGGFLMLTLAHHTSTVPRPQGGAVALLLLSILIYALSSALMEEVFFRGLFLPIFDRTLSQRGNLYQALLFGGIHYNVSSPLASLLKLVVFTFLGWYWGRATKETKGIGCSFLMHGAIIFILEIRANFFA